MVLLLLRRLRSVRASAAAVVSFLGLFGGGRGGIGIVSVFRECLRFRSRLSLWFGGVEWAVGWWTLCVVGGWMGGVVRVCLDALRVVRWGVSVDDDDAVS